MTADRNQRLLERLDEEYEDVSVQMEDLLQSFEYLQGEIAFALEDMEEELDKIREHLNLCSRLSAAYAGTTKMHQAPSAELLSDSLYADVPTAASGAEMVS